MLTGELIWGDDFLRELSQPARDPVIREMEEKTDALIREYYGRALRPTTADDYYGGFFGRLFR